MSVLFECRNSHHDAPEGLLRPSGEPFADKLWHLMTPVALVQVTPSVQTPTLPPSDRL